LSNHINFQSEKKQEFTVQLYKCLIEIILSRIIEDRDLPCKWSANHVI